ncbi:protein-tyrosine phosphatase family protein [Ketobacter alkanivorans]|uniref:Tyrosine specific protein phosphatases domain-containing protein n=1 Tax=Ketobacter alkanivorans TaxID=1917421 RepID=A0A2K9LL25_9GAMM|nr:dual specificity protein phosphatase family protein [Ketobacter alkanivorans]AUM13059.1 hypothetical protein Kalk_11765 [Ketobacter alkanivorans]
MALAAYLKVTTHKIKVFIMTAQLFGLNSYQNHTRKEMGFTNFQWTLNGAVARASQPGYTSNDSKHALGPVEITYLKSKGINCVISANHYDIPKVGRTLLNNANISHHHYQVGDYQPPSVFQLQNAANVIDAAINAGGAVLVYCGYGQGRTGTFVAGWAMQKYLTAHPAADINGMCNMAFLRDNFGVENFLQVNAVRASAALAPATAPAPAPMFGSGPINLGMPDNMSSGPKFSSFGSDISW